jgi:hypothetical protein
MKYLKVITKSSILFTLFYFIVSGLLIRCGDDGEVTTRAYPVLDTKSVTSITDQGVTLNAELLNLGSEGVADHGFVYRDAPHPTLVQSEQISLGVTSQKGMYSEIANRNLVNGKKYYVRAYAKSKSNGIIVYGEEVQFISQGGSAPLLLDFFPKQGFVQDTLIIKGTGFSNVTFGNMVSIGGIGSLVLKAKADSLWCLIPYATIAGENEVSISVGQFEVKASAKFILKALTVTSFTPTSVSFGDTITINGNNFPPTKSLISATLLGQISPIVSSSSTQLKVRVSDVVVIPQSAINVVIGIQSVITNEKVNLLAPVITSFTPTKGTNETEISINGNNFSPVKLNNKVVINDVSLTVIEAKKTQLKAKIPPGITPGLYPISVTVATQVISSPASIEIVKQ